MDAKAPSPLASVARVVPRVLVPGGGAIRIDQAVLEAVAAGAQFIEVVGGPGSGKTVALEFLREKLAHLGVDCLAQTDPRCAAVAAGSRGSSVVVVESTRARFPMDGIVMRLAPWGHDELIEWAIGEPREKRCEFVRRAEVVLRQSGESTPEVLAAVWSVVGEDQEIEGWSAAIDACLRRRVGDGPQAWWNLGYGCWLGFPHATEMTEALLREQPAAHLLARHSSVRLHAAAEWVLDRLHAGGMEELTRSMPENLLRQIAARLGRSAEVARTIRGALAVPNRGEADSNGASLLNLAGIAWRPEDSGARARCLRRALLAGVRWAGVRLAQADLTFADLRGADLAGADLARAGLHRADLSGCDLSRAQMQDARCVGARLRDAVLRGAHLDDARLIQVDLSGADMTGVRARGAAIAGSNLARAILRGAEVRQGIIRDCDLTEADLTGAVLRSSSLRSLDLRSCRIDDLEVEDGGMRKCWLGGVVATGLNCRATRFVDCDFTGSVFRGSTFAKARFMGCGLAEIWWQGVDLREADFTGSTFHMGSSRSGLVGSTIAGEGSRTGFYTDDYNEQDYRPPEEIAKADLRGADLRGAIVEGVDFYLVDLRGAIYDEKQADWFRKCGAILVARV